MVQGRPLQYLPVILMKKPQFTALILIILLVMTVPACLRQYDAPQIIAFCRFIDATWQEELYIINVDGSGEKRLTTSTERMVNPVWSPDGESIVYHSISGLGVIYMMDADGGNNRMITTGVTPTWSPDGKRLIYVRTGNIYTASAKDGSDEVQLTFSGIDTYPSWSPDGRLIVFLRDMGASYNIYIVNASDGSGLTLVSSTAGIADDSSPTWSPDGKKILFGMAMGLYTVNPDGTGETMFIPSGYNPSWSPNGRQIIFQRDVGGPNYDLFVINTDGTGERQLTFYSNHDMYPCFQGKPR